MPTAPGATSASSPARAKCPMLRSSLSVRMEHPRRECSNSKATFCCYLQLAAASWPPASSYSYMASMAGQRKTIPGRAKLQILISYIYGDDITYRGRFDDLKKLYCVIFDQKRGNDREWDLDKLSQEDKDIVRDEILECESVPRAVKERFQKLRMDNDVNGKSNFLEALYRVLQRSWKHYQKAGGGDTSASAQPVERSIGNPPKAIQATSSWLIQKILNRDDDDDA